MCWQVFKVTLLAKDIASDASDIVHSLPVLLPLLVLHDGLTGGTWLQEGQHCEGKADDGPQANPAAGLRQEGHVVRLAIIVTMLQQADRTGTHGHTHQCT